MTESYEKCSRCGEVDGHNERCAVREAMALDEAESIVMAAEVGVFKGTRGELAMAILRIASEVRNERGWRGWLSTPASTRRKMTAQCAGPLPAFD